MSPRKAKRLAAAEAARTKSSGRTHVLGILAGGAVITVFGAELTRVWRLGTLPRSRQIHSEDERRSKPIEAVMTLREGYGVSRTRENALFNMLASFTVAFGITRGITWTIREKGGFGPIKDVVVGDRHIHHFLPGGILALAAGGAAIGTKGEKLDSTSRSRSAWAWRWCSTRRRCCSSSTTSTGPRRACSVSRSRSPRSPCCRRSPT